MVLSEVGPILSFTNVSPIPRLLLLIGVFNEKAFVVGAPSKPTHCVRCNPKTLIVPLEPA